MIKFLSFAVKTQLNVHDLNNETGAGNVTDIRIMEFLDEEGKRIEAPAVSGRMLKHWHFEGMRNLILNGNYSSVPLCDGCRVGEPIRPAIRKDSTIVQVGKDENDAISNCAICDIHGYLIAQNAEGTTKGISSRRTSRAMFSWLMPVLGYETAQMQVIHTRVSQQEAIAERQGPSQMIFNKSYASGIYAFVSALDIERIGLVELQLGTNEPYAVDVENRKQRIKAAIEAYRLMLSGQIGASLSHSLPHQNPLELFVALSETNPLPFPVSPMYPDYLEKTIGLMPNGTQFLYWGNGTPQGVIKKNTIDEIFEELLSKI